MNTLLIISMILLGGTMLLLGDKIAEDVDKEELNQFLGIHENS